MRLVLLLCALPLAAQTQPFTFGVEGGFPAQNPIGHSNSKTAFLVGPTVSARLTPKLSLETGVLFHRLGLDEANGGFLTSPNTFMTYVFTNRATAIEIPILVKRYLFGEDSNWRPFLMAGPTIRRSSIHSFSSYADLTATPLSVNASNQDQTKWNIDPAVAAGVDFKTGRLHLEPQVRYSYWNAGKNTLILKNQVNFLLGFRY